MMLGTCQGPEDVHTGSLTGTHLVMTCELTLSGQWVRNKQEVA